MCNDDKLAESVHKHFGVSRRSFLRAAELAAVAGGVGMVVSATPASAVSAPLAKPGVPKHRTKLVLLGTAGGPILLDSHRKGISTAVVYGDRVYVVDLGHGAHTNFHAAGLAGAGESGPAFSRLRGLLFTHLHSDHIAEWPAVYLTGVTNVSGAFPEQPIKVFGPGDRAVLPRINPAGRPVPPVVNPELPMPGVRSMTGYLRQAFGHDLNDRIRDNNMQPLEALFQTHDIDISPYWTVDEAGIPPILDRGTRIPVWDDGEVKITATLVDHRPTAPAFAYRFDTPDGSIVVSGDTAPSRNLINLAKGADYLVHEVIDEEYVERLVAFLDESVREGVRAHLLESHTTIDQVGRVAEQAGVKNLVLTHLVPASNPAHRWKAAGRNFSGTTIVGDDLMQFGVGTKKKTR